MDNGKSRSKYLIASEDLFDELDRLDRTNQAQWLFLDPSDDFKGRWSIDSLWPEWFFDFEEIVGRYRTISPAKLSDFLQCARELDYRVVFLDEPEAVLDAYKHLSDPPPFEIRSDLQNTTNGLLPWQIAGFNKLVKDEGLNAGLVVWSTGTGKTVFIASAILWHEQFGHPFELALVVVKANNKADMNRKLLRLAGIESIIIDGTPQKRERLYGEITDRLKAGEKVVAVTNYEKFREDRQYFTGLLKKREILIFWDEIPTRLSNSTTKLWQSVRVELWDPFKAKKSGVEGAKPRPKWMRQWGLTATPVENDPMGVFNYVRLMSPPLLGERETFESEFVTGHNFQSGKAEDFHNLEKLEARLEHMVHRASKEDDPEIAAMFPKVIEDTLTIDWHPKDRALYDILTGKAAELVETDFSELNILAMIQVMQMICDAPSMIGESVKNRTLYEEWLEEEHEEWEHYAGAIGSEVAQLLLSVVKKKPTDDHHTKLETWREILMEKHPEDKVLTFMTWGGYGFRPLTAKLDEWGITYVTYEGTQKQADKAKNRFREDDSIKVFLSSDRGADSIDLPEAAVGVNYNLPWTWVRKRQRMRNVRVDSTLPTNFWYDLVMADSVEERKQEIIARKFGYHAALFDGKAIEESLSSKLTREDLAFILTGLRP
jgi:SNF2 family DNA or RNA helicase